MKRPDVSARNSAQWKDPDWLARRLEREPKRIVALRATLKGKKQSPELVEKRISPQRGLKRSDDFVAKITKAFSHPEIRAKRSQLMKQRLASGLIKVKYRDTAPELAVRKWLDFRGIKYETHVRMFGHEWDIVVESAKTIIEVDGCYWHGCKEHGDSGPDRSGLDAAKDRKAKRAGWRVIRVWEHDVHKLALP